MNIQDLIDQHTRWFNNDNGWRSNQTNSTEYLYRYYKWYEVQSKKVDEITWTTWQRSVNKRECRDIFNNLLIERRFACYRLLLVGPAPDHVIREVLEYKEFDDD